MATIMEFDYDGIWKVASMFHIDGEYLVRRLRGEYLGYHEWEKIEQPTTFSGAKNVCLGGSAGGSDTCWNGLKLWNQLILEAVEAVTTAYNAKVIWENAPDRSESKRAAWLKWNELSLKEAGQDYTFKERDNIMLLKPFPADSEAEKLFLDNWDKVCLKEIRKAKTVEEAKKAYSPTYKDGIAARKGWLKWNRLSLEEVKKATTPEALEEACKRAPDDSEAERTAMVMMYKIANAA